MWNDGRGDGASRRSDGAECSAETWTSNTGITESAARPFRGSSGRKQTSNARIAEKAGREKVEEDVMVMVVAWWWWWWW